MKEKVIIKPDEFSALVEMLATQMARGGEDLEGIAIVGIHKRGVPLAKRLTSLISKRWGMSPHLGTLDITLYRDDLSATPAQPIVGTTQIDFDVSGKRVVLVDDVLYTGRTARAAISEIIDFGRPRRIELAVLVDRGHQELPIRADYVGKKIKTTASQMVEVRLKETDGEDKVLLIDKEG
jgi:pyrimidine operon attenuation protein/uracil phosphoribosyltransferase